MNGYLLDTPLVAAYLRGRPGAIRLISPWVVANEVETSIIVYGEAFEYVSGFADPSRWQNALRALAGTIAVINLTHAIVERYAELRRAMRPPHGTGLIGDMDTLIAATALVYDRTLVTLDSDLSRVPGLSVMLLPRSAL